MKNKNKPKMSEIVTRTFQAEYRAEAEKGLIRGVPIVFNTSTDIGGWFEERIESTAIDTSILKDVALYYNHDIRFGKPHARSRKSAEKVGGMNLSISETGVNMLANLNLNRTDSNDLYLAIEDETLDGMSFMFRIEKERWERLDTDYPLRIIEKIGYIQEVSAVNYPAYQSTHVEVARSDLALDSDREALDNARAEHRSSLDNGAGSLDNDSKKLELEKAKIKNLLI